MKFRHILVYKHTIYICLLYPLNLIMIILLYCEYTVHIPRHSRKGLIPTKIVFIRISICISHCKCFRFIPFSIPFSVPRFINSPNHMINKNKPTSAFHLIETWQYSVGDTQVYLPVCVSIY